MTLDVSDSKAADLVLTVKKYMTAYSLSCLYSFRRCPYAMRARLGLLFAELPVELREITLKNKPAKIGEYNITHPPQQSQYFVIILYF